MSALIGADTSTLLIVDVQAKLLPAIHEGPRVLANCMWLVQVARRIGVPVLASEQYPQGLGPTAPELAALLPAETTRTKVHFSCVADGCFDGIEAWQRPQLVVAGTEAHVCVLQTVLDLAATGRQVFVVGDSVGSRRTDDRDLALARCRQHGIDVVSREMVAFEWLHRAGTDLFREVSRTFIR
ncbi:MAG: hydrolase [Betaproteobacteria bacterium]